MQVILKCLNLFCVPSCQKINYHKSQLFCLQSVDGALESQLSLLSDIPETNNLGKYLGVPSIYIWWFDEGYVR